MEGHINSVWYEGHAGPAAGFACGDLQDGVLVAPVLTRFLIVFPAVNERDDREVLKGVAHSRHDRAQKGEHERGRALAFEEVRLVVVRWLPVFVVRDAVVPRKVVLVLFTPERLITPLYFPVRRYTDGGEIPQDQAEVHAVKDRLGGVAPNVEVEELADVLPQYLILCR